jgi:hypothetical protein
MPGTALRSLDMDTLHASALPAAKRRVWAVASHASSSDVVQEFIEALRTASASLP